MAKVVLISGSPNPGSRLNGVLKYAEKLLLEEGLELRWIHVRDLPPEDLIYTRFDSPAIAEANRILAEADAVIVSSPIYKASYTGVLKTFLDLIPQKGLENKPVLPIAIGGSPAHLLAIDYAFKPVLSALGARYLSAGIYAVDTQITRSDDLRFTLDEELTERIRKTVREWTGEIRLRTAAAL
ncbi:NADPH-dependent FMN reductase [Paenibacillus sp. P26]|nr:NADPH-dependent FMN reductase [Paenibacillus sp. P26]